MSYVALYRAWRPQRFSDVVGQEHVVTTLIHALEMNRLAHAYLFAGPRGTGKTSLAKILAKAVNCEQPDGIEPCNVCPACTGINAGAVMDVVEMDAASNRGIDEIRGLLEQVRYVPTEVKKKVYIIDEVHMLTPEAFNALLKTLEEPPNYCLFVLATTELHKVPATIASRCQRFSFGRVKVERVVQRLQEVAATLSVAVEESALWLIARLTEGGLRDALSLLDQVVAFSSDHIGVEQVAEVTGGVSSEKIGELCSLVFAHDHGGLLSLLSAFWERGVDPSQLIVEMLSYLRDAILQKCGGIDIDKSDRVQYDPTFAVVISHVQPSILLQIAERMGHLQAEMRFQSQARLYIEVSLLAFIDQMHPGVDQKPVLEPSKQGVPSEDLLIMRQELQQLVQRIELLERKQWVENRQIAEQRTQEATEEAPERQIRNRAQETPLVRQSTSVSPMQSKGRNAWQGKQMNAQDQELLTTLEQRWVPLLEEMKRTSIQTRAWLYAGRPVGVFGHHLVIAFKSSLHAETVIKSPHRELIEEVLQQRLQRPVVIATILEDEWERVKNHMINGGSDQNVGKVSEPWVGKVIELLGEDRVRVIDE